MQTLPNGITIQGNTFTLTSSDDNFWTDNYVKYFQNLEDRNVYVYGGMGSDSLRPGNFFNKQDENLCPCDEDREKTIYDKNDPVTLNFFGGDGDDYFVFETSGSSRLYGGNGVDEAYAGISDFLFEEFELLVQADEDGVVLKSNNDRLSPSETTTFISADIELVKDSYGGYLMSDLMNNRKKFYSDEELSDMRNSLEPSSALVPSPALTPAPIAAPEISRGPAPQLLSGVIRSDQLKLQFNDAISDSLPRLNNFSLNYGSRKLTFEDVEVVPSAGQALLKLSKDIDSTAKVTLNYFDLASDQSSGVIQSKTGVDLASFSGFAIENQTEQGNLLTIEEGDFEKNRITLSLNAPLSSSIPSATRFKAKAGRKKLRIVDINTDAAEGIITLTTNKSIGYYESIFVTYADLAGDQIKGVIEDVAGNDMKTIRDFEIINGGYEEIPPKILSAEFDDGTLIVEFDSIINNTKLSKNRFKVRANGKKLRVKSASIDDDNESFVTLNLQTKRNQVIDLQSEVTLSYTDPKGDQSKQVVEDLFGNDLPSFSGYIVDIV